MNMKLFLLLIIAAFASEQKENDTENLILVKIEEDECTKMQKKTSNYIGVSYKEEHKKWEAYRRSKNEKKMVHNGCYKIEETAAHASDTLARKLMANGKEKHKLNFPDDDIEVYPKGKCTSSNYIGVSYNIKLSKWRTIRWSRKENKSFYNGYYKDEETAAHASDTLARELERNGEKNHALNFPDDDIRVLPEKKKTSSNYTGVSYIEKISRWAAFRHNKSEKKTVFNGAYENEVTAAHASDTLARKLMANGKQNLTLNFHKDETEVYPEERKTSSNYIGVGFNEQNSKWQVRRFDRKENKQVCNGLFENEETAAHASDTLARKLMANGKQNLRLNFPNDTEVYLINQRNKRKRYDHEDLWASQNK